MARLRVVLVLLALSWGFLLAEEPARMALVIGNSAYDGDAALANASNDANDVADALETIGWKVTKLINGDRKAMNRTVFEFRDALSASPDSTALLYYAGHGIQINGQNYLIPIKETFETADDVTADAVGLQSVLTAFDDGKVAISIVILDACRDNPFLKKSTRSLGGSRGLNVVNKPSNVVGSAVMFSTAPGETAADGTGRNGVFTSALLKYITTDIKLQDLATKVTGEVRKMTGGKQVPFNSISLSDDYYMVPASLRTAAPVPATTDLPLGAGDSASGQVAATDNLRQKVSLVARRSSIVQQKTTLLKGYSWTTWVGWAGISSVVAGGGLAAYGLWGYDQAKAAYAVATVNFDQAGWDAARAQKILMNTLFSVGVGLLGTGALELVVPLLLGPDTSALDKQLNDIDLGLAQLGGS